MGYDNGVVFAEVETALQNEQDRARVRVRSAAATATPVSTASPNTTTSTTKYRQILSYGYLLRHRSGTPLRKRRVHFHSFMQDIHHPIHNLKQQDLRLRGLSFKVDTGYEHNLVYRLACALASEVSLLCFDEFQVVDIAGAIILSQFFAVLFGRGMVVVATSNQPLRRLYEGRLNRAYFLTFVGLLQRYCTVHDIDGSVDYWRLSTGICVNVDIDVDVDGDD